MKAPPTDDELNEYADGGLSEQRRAEIAAWLLENPSRAAEVERLRELNDALRGLGANILDEPVPERLRDVLSRSSRSGTAGGRRSKKGQAMAAAIVFAIGAVAGWSVGSAVDTEPSELDLVLDDATRAHAWFAGERDFPVQFPPEASSHFETLATRIFERTIAAPDLRPAGYAYRGAVLLPTGVRPSALLLFEGRSADDRISVALWRATNSSSADTRSRFLGEVASRHWISEGFGVAVLGTKDNDRLDVIADEISAFYASFLLQGHRADRAPAADST